MTRIMTRILYTVELGHNESRVNGILDITEKIYRSPANLTQITENLFITSLRNYFFKLTK